MWPFQRSGYSEIRSQMWRRVYFFLSRRCAACKCNEQCVVGGCSYQISYSWCVFAEIGQPASQFCHIHLFPSDSCKKRFSCSCCVRSPPPQVWWSAFLWLRPPSTTQKRTLWFQSTTRSLSHAGKCVCVLLLAEFLCISLKTQDVRISLNCHTCVSYKSICSFNLIKLLYFSILTLWCRKRISQRFSRDIRRNNDILVHG